MTEQDTTQNLDVDETEQIRPDDGTNEEVATDVASTESGNSEDEVEEAPEDEPETFPRDYVERLRKENAGYRERAKKAEQYAQELHAARVAATGRLADPSDLPFDPTHLEDMSKLEAAIDELLHAKPHLALRKPRGDVGQGASAATGDVDLLGIMRSRV